MGIGKDCAIFMNINSDKYTDEEKVSAIRSVVGMPTHNGVTKDAMLEVIKYALRRTAEDDKAREEGLTRGAELVRAENLIGKRLYVCWRGDTADQVEIRDISSVCITDGGKIALEDGPYDGFICYMDEIGKWDDDKYVGLTRQEAEAALGGVSNG